MGENLRKLVEKFFFMGKLTRWCHQKTPSPQISRIKLLRMATKPRNLQEFSPSKVSHGTLKAM